MVINNGQCEKIIHGMINEKRLDAVIDQVSGYIDFTQGKKIIFIHFIHVEFDAYNNWTEGINNFCTSLDKLVSKVVSK